MHRSIVSFGRLAGLIFLVLTIPGIHFPEHAQNLIQSSRENEPPSPPVITESNAGQIRQIRQIGSGFIDGLAYSPDGVWLATQTSVGLYLFQTAHLENPPERIGLQQAVVRFAFSPDGKRVAILNEYGVIDLWNVETRKLETSLGGTLGTLDIIYSPDGKKIASLSKNNIIRIWSIERGEVIDTIDDSDDKLYHYKILYSPDGNYIADLAPMLIWRISDKKVVDVPPVSPNILGAAYTPDGKILALSFYGDDVRLSNGSRNVPFLKPNPMMSAVEFSADATMMVFFNSELSGPLPPVGGITPVALLGGRYDFTSKPAISPDQKTAVVAVGRRRLQFYSLPDGKLVRTLETQSLPGFCSSLVALDRHTFIAGFFEGYVQKWDLDHGQLLKDYGQISDSESSLALSPDGQMISASRPGSIILIDSQSGAQIAELTGHKGGTFSHAFSANGRVLASASYDNTIWFWDVPNRKLLNTVLSPGLFFIHFAPNEKSIALGGSDGIVRLMSVPDGKILMALSEQKKDVFYPLVFSPDSTMLAASVLDGQVKLWQVPGGKLIRTLQGASVGASAIAFSPDGTLLATSSDDGVIYLWNISDGRLLTVLLGHTQGIGALTFTPDSTLLISASGDGTIRIWGVPD